MAACCGGDTEAEEWKYPANYIRTSAVRQATTKNTAGMIHLENRTIDGIYFVVFEDE